MAPAATRARRRTAVHEKSSSGEINGHSDDVSLTPHIAASVPVEAPKIVYADSCFPCAPPIALAAAHSAPGAAALALPGAAIVAPAHPAAAAPGTTVALAAPASALVVDAASAGATDVDVAAVYAAEHGAFHRESPPRYAFV